LEELTRGSLSMDTEMVNSGQLWSTGQSQQSTLVKTVNIVK